MDEHAEGVHWHEVDVDFKEGKGMRPRHEVLRELREKVEGVGDVYVNVGQPISHRLDHLLSGVRAQIAIKIFGPELAQLRKFGAQAERALKEVPGLVDLSLEPLVPIPQLKIAIDREAAAKFALRPGSLAEDLEMALNGEAVSSIIEEQRLYEIYVRLDDESRSSPASIEKTLLKTLPNGQTVSVGDVAQV